MTIALHVDDLMITNLHDENLDSFFEHLKRTYKRTKIVRGQIRDYVGMTFNFSVTGEVKITMENCVNEILADCGVTQVASTPASPMLFNIRVVRLMSMWLLWYLLIEHHLYVFCDRVDSGME